MKAKTRRIPARPAYLPGMHRAAQRLLGLAAAGALLLGTGVPGAQAATKAKPKAKAKSPAAFSVEPSPTTPSGFFDLSIRPGQTQSYQAEVVNTGASTAKGFLYSTDSTTGQTSGAVYLARGQLPQNISPWIKLGVHTLSLKPHAGVLVPFTVSVPRSAGSGQRLAGLVADLPNAFSSAHNTKAHQSIRITFQTQAVNAVLMNLGPPYTCAPQITGVNATVYAGYQALDIGVLNASNVLLKGKLNLTVVNNAGKILRNESFSLDTLVNDTQIQFPAVIGAPHPLPVGSYSVRVGASFHGLSCIKDTEAVFPFKVGSAQFYSTHGAPLHAPYRFPWLWAILGAVAALLLLLAALALWRRRKPKAFVAPVVTFSATAHGTLLTDDGQWKGGRIKSLSYQWGAADDVPEGEALVFTDIAGATASTHVITADEEGKRVQVTVTAHGARKSEVPQSSEPTIPIPAQGAAAPSQADDQGADGTQAEASEDSGSTPGGEGLPVKGPDARG
jgi:hypothetical protein